VPPSAIEPGVVQAGGRCGKRDSASSDGSSDGEVGSAALMAAAEIGDAALVRTLCRHNASLGAADAKRRTPLHVACAGGHAGVARALLYARAEVDSLAGDVTPLMLAAKDGSSVVCSLLLENRANADAARKKDSMNSLMMASRGGHADAVNVLLSHVKQLDAVRTDNGETALLAACKNAEAEVVAILLAAGASTNARSFPTAEGQPGPSAQDYAALSPELAAVFESQEQQARVTLGLLT